MCGSRTPKEAEVRGRPEGSRIEVSVPGEGAALSRRTATFELRGRSPRGVVFEFEFVCGTCLSGVQKTFHAGPLSGNEEGQDAVVPLREGASGGSG